MQSSHRGILDLDSGRVLIGVERSAHTQALRDGGAGDQVDDGLVVSSGRPRQLRSASNFSAMRDSSSSIQ
jgi:hypothetical protein